MSDRVFEVGDRVRIRDWDDMAAEFGVDEYEGIPCDATFIPEMRHLCGLEFVVSNVRELQPNRYRYETEDPEFADWRISGDMLEPAEPEPDEGIAGVDPEDFLDALTDWF